MKIVTHNAKFHTDDVFAVATLLMLYPEATVIRTRDQAVIQEGDFVVDVGNVYEQEQNRFDHHQLGGAGKRENGVPYSSFGLVWKKFGSEVCGTQEVASRIDQKFVQAVDAGDNGMDTFKPIMTDLFPALIQGVVNQYRLTWKETGEWDERFMDCVGWAKGFLERMIKITQDIVEGELIVREALAQAVDKRLIVIDEKYDLGRELVSSVLVDIPEVIYAVLYRHDHKNWQLVAIAKNRGTYELRKALPEAWRAKINGELESASGVDGATFCHRNGFMCTANTRESILKLAELALNA